MQLRLFFKGIFYLQRFHYAVEKGSKAGLLRTARLIRGASIRTLRISSRTSLPGNPPFAKTRGGLRLIEYVVYNNGAIIGPIKFNSSNTHNKPVPHIHEFGGTFFTRTRQVYYPQRSFMYHTLKQLIARGMIAKEFRVGLARQFNS